MEVGIAEHFQRPNTAAAATLSFSGVAFLTSWQNVSSATKGSVYKETVSKDGTLGVRFVNQTAVCDSPRLLEDGASRHKEYAVVVSSRTRVGRFTEGPTDSARFGHHLKKLHPR